jgi:hypothetical protein
MIILMARMMARMIILMARMIILMARMIYTPNTGNLACPHHP